METFPGVKQQQLSFGPGCEMQLLFYILSCRKSFPNSRVKEQKHISKSKYEFKNWL